jgi:hypothetical protein
MYLTEVCFMCHKGVEIFIHMLERREGELHFLFTT